MRYQNVVEVDTLAIYILRYNTLPHPKDFQVSSFYIKSTDASGMPQPLRVFDYSERTASQKQPTQTAQKPKEEYVTRQEFNALTARFDALTADKPLTRKKKEADNEQPSV